MDSKTRRKYKRASKRLFEKLPHKDERNPSPEQERDQAQWLLSAECKEVMKHVPEIHAKSVKEAEYFLKYGKLLPLTKTRKRIHSSL